LLIVAVLLSLAVGGATQATADWKPLAPGLELRFLVAKIPSPVGDSRIVVLRIDPTFWQLELVGRSSTGESAGRTAREWAKGHGLAVAINAGMFGSDHKTHIGYMEFRGDVELEICGSYETSFREDNGNTTAWPIPNVLGVRRRPEAIAQIK